MSDAKTLINRQNQVTLKFNRQTARGMSDRVDPKAEVHRNACGVGVGRTAVMIRGSSNFSLGAQPRDDQFDDAARYAITQIATGSLCITHEQPVSGCWLAAPNGE